jgi:hypothetical protein
MDGLTYHGSDEMENYCLDNACFVQFFSLPHSSGQAEPCDVGIFGPIKANVSGIYPAADFSKQGQQVLKIHGALQTTFHPQTIVHAFTQGGIMSQYCVQYECLTCAIVAVRPNVILGR